MKRAIAITIACIAVSVQAGQEPTFMMYGPAQNAASCAAFSASIGTERRAAYEWWLLGFVSGTGFGLLDHATLAHTDTDAIEGWVIKYCGEHPLDSFSGAAIALVNELKARAPMKGY
jgi:hypothetical protein